nr:MAG TPA: hypothetical protein [Caudoviricetes sp.]
MLSFVTYPYLSRSFLQYKDTNNIYNSKTIRGVFGIIFCAFKHDFRVCKYLIFSI